MSKLMKYQMLRYDNSGLHFKYKEVDKFFEYIRKLKFYNNYPFTYRKMGYKKGYSVLNVPVVFDTETTSEDYYTNHKTEKVAFMWVWMICVSGISLYGREWSEFFDLLNRFKNEFNLDSQHRMIIYIRNLPFDFSFFKNQCKISDWFLMDSRKALNVCIDENCFEFRCSYLLSGVSLETTGKNLVKNKVQKLVGELDYKKIRHSKTPIEGEDIPFDKPLYEVDKKGKVIWSTELAYCINDVRVDCSYIFSCMEQELGSLAKVPTTFTGYVRRDIEEVMKADKYWYRKVKSLKLTTEEYLLWKRAFCGGFTHCNADYVGQTIGELGTEDIASYDYTSSYPSQMIAMEYPMGNGRLIEWTDWKNDYDNCFKKFTDLIGTNILVFEIKIWNLQLKPNAPDAPLALEKCDLDTYRPYKSKECYINGKFYDIYGHDNGKIIRCEYCETVMTSMDFLVLNKFYDLSKAEYEIGKCYAYEKGYLPKPYIEKILDYYGKKTTLKGVVGKEVEYQSGKARINALYGLLVCAIIHEIYEDWGARGKDPDNVDELIEKYNNSRKRVGWYPWGVCVTAYARAALLNGIYRIGKLDYLYSDTDSIKMKHCSEHLDYILEYNIDIQEKHKRCLEHYGLDTKLLRPKTIDVYEDGVLIKKSEEKPLGVWDFDGHYSRFKALHSKCYIYEVDKDPRNDPKTYGLHCTIAGLAKEKAQAYLLEQEDPFEAFNMKMEVPIGKSGKNCHFYNNETYTFEVTDYLGNKETVTTYGGVNLSEIAFNIKRSPDFALLLEVLGKGKEGD